MWLHCLATFRYCSKKEIKGAGNPFSLSPSLVNIWLVSEIRPFIVLFYDTFVFQNIITIVSEVKYFGCIILSGVLYQYESQIYTCHLTMSRACTAPYPACGLLRRVDSMFLPAPILLSLSIFL